MMYNLLGFSEVQILPLFLIMTSSLIGKRSLAPDVISPEPVDGFLKFKRHLEAENILHKLYRIDF